MKLKRYVLVVFFTLILSVICLNFVPLPYIWMFLMWAIVLAIIAAKSQRQLLKIVAVNLCIALIMFMLIESALWAFPDFRFRKSSKTKIQREGTCSNLLNQEVPYLGYKLEENYVCTSRNFTKKKVLYDVTYSTDANSLRITPPTKNIDSNAILFFGGSFTFGEGVNDQESMPYRVAEHTNSSFHVFNFGVGGYGPHQMLSSLEHEIVERVLNGIIPSVVVYQTAPFHAARSAGLSSWDKNGPRYTLTETGEILYIGTFSQHLSWIKKSSIGKRLIARKGNRKINRHDVELMIGIIAKTRDFIAHKWPEAEFHVLLWDNKSWVSSALKDGFNHNNVSLHCISKVLPWIKKRPNLSRIPIDHHPSAMAHDSIANYLTQEIINK